MRRSSEITRDDIATGAKIEAAAVPFKVLLEEFGEERLTFDEHGNYNFHLEGRAEVEKFEEMDQQRSRLEADAGDKRMTEQVWVMLKDRYGRKRPVPEQHAEAMIRSPRGRAMGLTEASSMTGPTMTFRDGKLIRHRRG